MVGSLQGPSSRFQITNFLCPYRKDRKTTKLFQRCVCKVLVSVMMFQTADPPKGFSSKSHEFIRNSSYEFGEYKQPIRAVPLTIMLKMKTYQVTKVVSIQVYQSHQYIENSISKQKVLADKKKSTGFRQRKYSQMQLQKIFKR